VQCKNCHRIGDTGSTLGPDLTHIGSKFNRAQLLESILEPSKAIDPKYVTYLVETTRGLVHTGLLVEKTDQVVVLKDAQDKEIRIPASDVQRLVPQRQSLMPELQLRDMTTAQVADLLGYLVSLK
jgi:putative heme-binding domain-containing protein